MDDQARQEGSLEQIRKRVEELETEQKADIKQKIQEFKNEALEYGSRQSFFDDLKMKSQGYSDDRRNMEYSFSLKSPVFWKNPAERKTVREEVVDTSAVVSDVKMKEKQYFEETQKHVGERKFDDEPTGNIVARLKRQEQLLEQEIFVLKNTLDRIKPLGHGKSDREYSKLEFACRNVSNAVANFIAIANIYLLSEPSTTKDLPTLTESLSELTNLLSHNPIGFPRDRFRDWRMEELQTELYGGVARLESALGKLSVRRKKVYFEEESVGRKKVHFEEESVERQKEHFEEKSAERQKEHFEAGSSITMVRQDEPEPSRHFASMSCATTDSGIGRSIHDSRPKKQYQEDVRHTVLEKLCLDVAQHCKTEYKSTPETDDFHVLQHYLTLESDMLKYQIEHNVRFLKRNQGNKKLIEESFGFSTKGRLTSEKANYFHSENILLSRREIHDNAGILAALPSDFSSDKVRQTLTRLTMMFLSLRRSLLSLQNFASVPSQVNSFPECENLLLIDGMLDVFVSLEDTKSSDNYDKCNHFFKGVAKAYLGDSANT